MLPAEARASAGRFLGGGESAIRYPRSEVEVKGVKDVKEVEEEEKREEQR